MKIARKIHSLPGERITPFQKRALTLLTKDSGLSAERILDILLVEALLGHFMGRGMEISGTLDLSATRTPDVNRPRGP
ncbi:MULTISPECIES: hypothetical protein [Acidithiobacillus]|uniref:hypothetical protein n=1 Tax=Acidithiobacillus TaxID=119977 RepID=UPI0012D2FC1F|nr:MULTISPECIES: hypothetical protein [Acidithiobacillus]MBU2743455.1 hypothetical protein [Acidithiobacillus albertensis]